MRKPLCRHEQKFWISSKIPVISDKAEISISSTSLKMAKKKSLSDKKKMF